MKTTKSTYQANWQGLSLAHIDQRMAAMPVAGEIDQLNWPADYPEAPKTQFTLAHTDEMLYVRYEVKGELPLSVEGAPVFTHPVGAGMLIATDLHHIQLLWMRTGMFDFSIANGVVFCKKE